MRQMPKCSAMNDEEIDSRFPGPFPPYLRKKVVHRLLHPVNLGSRDYHFVLSLLYVMKDDPDKPTSAYPNIVKSRLKDVDPQTAERCVYVLRQTSDRLQYHTNRLLKRMSRALALLDPDDKTPLYQYLTGNTIDRRALKKRYKTLLTGVTEILRRHDPIGIGEDAPLNEYSMEAGTIVPKLFQATSSEAVRRIVHEQLVRWFAPSSVSPENTLSSVADEIWAQLQAQSG